MKYVIINEGTISIKRIMCNILIVYFTRKQWGNTDNLFISMALYGYTVIELIAGIIIWCGMAMGTRGRAGIFVRGGGAQNAPHMYKKGLPHMYKKAPRICTKTFPICTNKHPKWRKK